MLGNFTLAKLLIKLRRGQTIVHEKSGQSLHIHMAIGTVQGHAEHMEEWASSSRAGAASDKPLSLWWQCLAS